MSKRRKIAASIVVVALLSGAGGGAVAHHAANHDFARASRGSQTTVSSFGSFVDVHSTDYTNVPNAGVTIVVPPGKRALLVATFQSSVLCAGGGGLLNQCLAQILFRGQPGEPDGAEFAWATAPSSSDDQRGAHSMIRWRKLGPGRHRVQVQARATDTLMTYSLGGYTLRVDRILI